MALEKVLNEFKRVEMSTHLAEQQAKGKGENWLHLGACY
jgi:hypothetical protein